MLAQRIRDALDTLPPPAPAGFAEAHHAPPPAGAAAIARARSAQSLMAGRGSFAQAPNTPDRRHTWASSPLGGIGPGSDYGLRV